MSRVSRKMAIFLLTLVRHGETKANKDRVIQGQQDTTLSDKGRKQAKLCGQRLQNEAYTHVYASDLKRALETCEIILQNSKATSSAIVQDQRLRERKFGNMEGSKVSEYVTVARKHRCKHVEDFSPEGGESLSQHFGNYQGKFRDEFYSTAMESGIDFMEFCPLGGETLIQVKDRSVEFFNELCQKLVESAEKDTNTNIIEGTPASIKKRHPNFYLGSSPGTAVASPESPLTEYNTLLLESPQDTAHGNSGSTSSSGCSSLGAESQEHLSEASSDTYTSTDDKGNHPRGIRIDNNGGRVFHPVFDSDIRTNIIGPQRAPFGCPNVSLSPICEQNRLSSISSISSGRNSFDECDVLPALLADVLVVSHGGLIRMLITHFLEELGCRIPGDHNFVMKSPYNTSVSKFTITVEEGETPLVTCLLFNDKEHLMGMEEAELESTDGV